jgi:hypothetical protein
MPSPTIDGVVLDHIAHAVPEWSLAWPRYVVELGASWHSGGPGPGFAPGQIQFANRARLEALMPFDVTVNDFLARFLGRSGPGPHHLTFKVPDLELALDLARRAGFTPTGIDRSQPEWMEAFLHPKQATGVVVQLAQASEGWVSPAPEGYPTERRRRPDGTRVPAASLQRVVHAVADLQAGVDLFGTLLGGQAEDRGVRGGEEWIDLRWDGPLAVRLVAPHGGTPSAPLVEWLNGRTGRIHHIQFAAGSAGELTAARPAPADLPGLAGADLDGLWVVDPADNLGLRLVVAEV